MDLRRGILMAVDEVVAGLKEQAIPVVGKSDIESVATISANNDETIGKLIAEAFAKVGKESVHNTNYWRNEKYLGIGPSAHSFNEHSRQWNVANNAKYLESISQNKVPQNIEELSLNNRFNEYLMTSLRTTWGTDLGKINTSFGPDFKTHILSKLTEYEEKDWLVLEKDHLYLTKNGKLFADRIAADLFIVDDEN
jgi:oxygen-independent coproporphyrinogen-3 oxidase